MPWSRVIIGLIVLLLMPVVWAKGVYQTTEEFAAEKWPDTAFNKAVYWLTPTDKLMAKQLFERDYIGLRIRYLSVGQQTLWTLEEIGKEQPITVGVIVGPEGVVDVRILAYRESRGGEVKYPFFTEQFLGATLTSDSGISTHIDNISGATLSVGAVKRVVAWALYLHSQVPLVQ